MLGHDDVDDPGFIERSISAPPLSAYSGFDFDASAVPSRLNPRMPKPVRSGHHESGDIADSNGHDSYMLDGLGTLDSLDDSHLSHIQSLVIDSKPRTPLDLIQADFPSTPSAVYSSQKLEESNSPQTHPPDETDELDDVLTGIDQTTLAMQELYVADEEPHSPNATSQNHFGSQQQSGPGSQQGQQQVAPSPAGHMYQQQNHQQFPPPQHSHHQQQFNGYGYQQGAGPAMGMYPPFQPGQQQGMGMDGFGRGQMQQPGMGYGMDGTAPGLGGQPHQHQGGFFMGQGQQGQGYINPYYRMGGAPQGGGFIGQGHMPGMQGQGIPEVAYSNNNTGGDSMNFMHYSQQQGQMLSPAAPYWAPQHQQQDQHQGGGMMMYPPHYNQPQPGHMMGGPQHQGGRGYGYSPMRSGQQQQGGISSPHKSGKGQGDHANGAPDNLGSPSRDQGGTDGQGQTRRSGGRGAHQGRGGGAANHTQTQVARDAVVEDFRNTYGKGRQWEIRDLVGHVVPFCQDQHGSRFIQQRLEVASDTDKEIVFDEVLPSAHSLMTDVFGNYVIQKLFEFGTAEQCETLASLLMGQAVTLALQMYGCRVIQKALEYVLTPRLIALVGEFEGQQVLRCVHDQNGNHVIQKCIEVVSRVAKESPQEMTDYLSSRIQFIIQAFQGRVKELSMHPYGCRVVQRILEHCTNTQKAPVLEELRQCCRELIQDQYGNYVIQHVMQHGWETDRAILIREVQSRLLDYSQHKFASNVVEKCIQFADRRDRDEMIWTIINVTFDLNNPVDAKTGQCVLENMVRDPYANYVVQKVIDVSNEAQRGAIIRYVRENIVQLRRYTYGKHIIVRLEKVSGEKF
mmetsp:Transcript_14444/g.21710  ORF Transcript_14444/g.21710 Transcript_14444/m.21710 type:complete len:846 (+) Transcript_14444:139-2676(+)|eukprot:CAMPEP_0185026440 /NCGR_PEP_ID=MMETSP1103-20130426/10635_1 /TAXON_ID=36769 /ORGANISM="Paraphysomonas bandaiensis, Strain Caron Lab Isolate" /LENGTH=845 /DNA_ID=CAMNT_0027560021 /DNA_START=89 /DNA_END=2626 /DNA_ORIENTATION=+